MRKFGAEIAVLRPEDVFTYGEWEDTAIEKTELSLGFFGYARIFHSGISISAVTTKFLTDSIELSHCLRVV